MSKLDSSAKSACESVGSGLIVSNWTLLLEDREEYYRISRRRGPMWVGAKERVDERGSYMFLDDSDFSSGHPAWPEGGQLRRSAESEPALCVVYWPEEGVEAMECTGEALHWRLQEHLRHTNNVLCDDGQVVSLCSWHECPDWSGHDWYVRSRSRPC